MEGFSRANHGTNAPGPVPAGPSPSTYSFSLPITQSYQSPMPNFKIKIATPTRAPDPSPDLVSSTERPQKRRKLKEDPAKPVVVLDDEGPPPSSSQQSSTSNNEASRSADDGHFLPFPARRPRTDRGNRVLGKSSGRPSLTNDTIKYGPCDVPEQAVRYQEGRADYFPWEGDHVEDRLTEKGTQTGHFKKVPNLPVELSSSRVSILSALKNKPGVESMSSLMAATLARRGSIAAIVSRNNFKPPPRVTLTDTRREAWLKELAANEVPLRRLSKTIPHGIRGKPLLEQCLAKSVPIWRAIWLVKCIGSNEIRAFRRRGAGSQTFHTCAESKWIKEWTDSIVDTMASLVQAPTAGEHRSTWQQNLLYLLALVQRIYEENLLDKDLFYDGLVQEFRKSTTDGVRATWIAILTPYSTDISSFCHRGRQFLGALLDYTIGLTAQKSNDHVNTLAVRCKSLIAKIMRGRPQCAILPDSWQSYEELLATIVAEDGHNLGRQVETLRRQNAILSRETHQVVALDFPRSSSAVIAMCDRSSNAFEPAELLSSCQKLIADSSKLAEILIKWAIDPFRPGLRPIYATVRLLRLMHKSGFDAQEYLLKLLESSSSLHAGSSSRLFQLVVELVRSKHFSVSKYLQRRMVKGISAITEENLEILSHLPPQTISPEVLNLASSLCEQKGCTFLASPAEIQTASSKLDALFLKSGAGSAFATDVQAFVSSLRPNMRHALALHMRKEIASRRDQQAYPSPDDHHQMDIDSSISYAPVPSIITVLELVEDFPLSADILLMMIPSCSPDALRLVSRCTLCHREVFQAIGALEHLLKGIMKRYATLYQQEQRQRSLVLALVDLMATVHGSERTVAILKEHLSAMLAGNEGIAPSPVSDQMVDVLQQSHDVHSLADLENMLLSESILDENVLQKMLRFLFRTLMSNAGDTEKMVHTLNILACMKTRNEDAFRKMLQQWLDQVFQSDDMRIAIQVVPWIIAGGMLSIADVVVGCIDRTTTAEKKAWATGLAPNVFVATLKPPRTEFLNSMEHYYRLKTAQLAFSSKEPALLASLISLVLDATSSSNDSVAKRARQLSSSAFFESVFLNCLCSSSTSEDSLVGELQRLASKGVPVGELLVRMLKCDEVSQSSSSTESEHRPLDILRKVASKVDDTNVVPCQLLTQMQLAELQHGAPIERANCLKEAAVVLCDPTSKWRKQSDCWDILLNGVSPEFIDQLHSHVLSELLSLIAKVSMTAGSDSENVERTQFSQLFCILEASESHLSQQESSNALESTLKTFHEYDTALEIDAMDSDGALRPTRTSTMLLARLIGIYIREPHCTGVSQDMLMMLCTMICKAWSYFSIESSAEATETFGIPPCNMEMTVEAVLVYASSLLSDEMRAKCLTVLRTKVPTVDRRIEFILGRSNLKNSIHQFLAMIEERSDNDAVVVKTEAHGLADTPDTPHRSSGDSAIPKARPYYVDHWETIQEALPEPSISDSCLDLGLFGARRVVL